MLFKSNIFRNGMYKHWRENAVEAQVIFADEVYAMAEANYEAGGDVIVESFEPGEIIEQFKHIDDVKSFIGLKIEQELNTRWGEDDDPQLERARAFDAGWK